VIIKEGTAEGDVLIQGLAYQLLGQPSTSPANVDIPAKIDLADHTISIANMTDTGLTYGGASVYIRKANPDDDDIVFNIVGVGKIEQIIEVDADLWAFLADDGTQLSPAYSSIFMDRTSESTN
jgi:hypothetical protein